MVETNKTQRRDVLLVDPRNLQIEEGFNTRLDYGDIDGLKNSIIQNGVENPLKGYKDGETFVIIDGHRRYEAVMSAIKEGHEIARIPFLSSKKKPMEERIFDIAVMNDGKPLTSLELGETYKRLIKFNFKVSEIAERVGKTVKHVSDLVSVASSSKEVKDMVNNGVISATLVAEISSEVKDVEKAEEVIKTAIKEKSPEKKKVTRKDVQKTKLVPSLRKTYTQEEVIELLKRQRTACAANLSNENDKNLVESCELVLKSKEKKN